MDTMQYTHLYRSPLGTITLAADSEGLTGLWFEGQKYFAATLDAQHEETMLPIFEQTRRWLDTCADEHMLHDGPVRPMITPRFTPSTSDEYMRGLGELAREYNVPAQSHLSENPGEIAWVAELCPGTKFYGESYSRFGLFGNDVPTVMAHCIYSPDAEAALMKRNRVMIAHCPTSNENVIAGIAPAAKYLHGGWRIGHGSGRAGQQAALAVHRPERETADHDRGAVYGDCGRR